MIIEEHSTRRNAEYKAEEKTFRVRLDTEKLSQRVLESSISWVLKCVRMLFTIILSRCKEGLQSTDLMRICIFSAGLDKPISTTLMLLSELTVEKVLTVIMKVLQSKEEIKLDETFQVDVITLQRDVGTGKRKVTNVEIDSVKKRCVLAN